MGYAVAVARIGRLFLFWSRVCLFVIVLKVYYTQLIIHQQFSYFFFSILCPAVYPIHMYTVKMGEMCVI